MSSNGGTDELLFQRLIANDSVTGAFCMTLDGVVTASHGDLASPSAIIPTITMILNQTKSMLDNTTTSFTRTQEALRRVTGM